MTAGRVFVVGAGMAGLAAATAAAEAGRRVHLFEAAPRPGGRCRSFHDEALGTDIDNGNHLLLSGNKDAMRYLKRIGTEDTVELLPPSIPFVDIASGERWTVDLSGGRIPWWVFNPSRRVPGTGLGDYWASRKISDTAAGPTVADRLSGTGKLYERFWKPLAVSVLNTQPEEAAADLLLPVLRETVFAGGDACRPVLARRGLGFSLAEPALAYLTAQGGEVSLSARVREIRQDGGAASALVVDGESISLERDDTVVLAVTPGAAAAMVPAVQTPDDYRAILNVHFKVPSTSAGFRVLGIIGGVAEWLFLRGGIASVTVSAAETYIEASAEELAQRIWADISGLLDLPDAGLPPFRVIKEKRATFAQTPDQIGKRPGPHTSLRNVLLAGDWTDTGLPATIEGAIRSGHTAAYTILNT